MSSNSVNSEPVRVIAAAVALCMVLIQGCAGDGSAVSGDQVVAGTTSTSDASVGVSIDETSSDTAEQADRGNRIIIADSHDDEDPDKVLSVIGVVTSVVGDLVATAEVRIVTEGGVEMIFIPAASATFDGGPVAHIRDHLISGESVRIDYVETTYGVLRATYMEDGDHDH